MSTNTLASALAAARKSSLPPVMQPQPAMQPQATRVSERAGEPILRPMGRALPELSDADALMIAIQRSARTVDDIMTRRMLLASGGWGQVRGR